MDNNDELSYNEQRSVFAKSFPGYKKALISVTYFAALGSLVWFTHAVSNWDDAGAGIAVVVTCLMSAIISYRIYFGEQQLCLHSVHTFFALLLAELKWQGKIQIIVCVVGLCYLMHFDERIYGVKMLITVIMCGYSFIVVHEIFFRGLLLDKFYYVNNRINPKKTTVKILFLEGITLLLFLGTFISKVMLAIVWFSSRYSTEVSMLEREFFTNPSGKKYFSVKDAIVQSVVTMSFMIAAIVIIVIGRGVVK